MLHFGTILLVEFLQFHLKLLKKLNNIKQFVSFDPLHVFIHCLGQQTKKSIFCTALVNIICLP